MSVSSYKCFPLDEKGISIPRNSLSWSNFDI